MTKKYKHLFFDLDKTIWDFDRNSENTIKEIYDELNLKDKGVEDFDEFHRIYEGHNLKLWDKYRRDEISKQELMVKRFKDALLDFGLEEPETAEAFSLRYLEILPSKTGVFPGTHKALEYLSGKYQSHIITNGFSEVQFTKLNNAGLKKYFTHIIISEDAGAKKPDVAIFEYALRISEAMADSSMMIGDDIEVDLLGAKSAGMDQVYFNPHRINHTELLTFEIFEMEELIGIL
jgi:putative hydrolase of the HAD superfamily